MMAKIEKGTLFLSPESEEDRIALEKWMNDLVHYYLAADFGEFKKLVEVSGDLE